MTRHDYKLKVKEREFIIKLNRKLARLGYPLCIVPPKIKAPKPVRKIGWLEYYTNLKNNGRKLSEVC